MISCNISPASEDVADFIVRYSPRAVESLYELARTRCVNLVKPGIRHWSMCRFPVSSL